MLPLATVGFISAGLFFAVYAYTFHALITKKIPGILKHFAYAYYALAGAFLLWGVASFLGTQAILNESVIAGNVLLFVSSLFLINIYFAKSKNKKLLLISWVFLSVLFIWWRLTYFPPQPYLTDGILVFNTQQPVGTVIGLLFLFIWLPTNLKVAQLISSSIQAKGVSFIYSSVYIMATVAAVLFIATKTEPIIILSFAAVVICFAMLIISNLMIEKLAK